MIYAVFSIGQFVSSNLDLLKNGFTEWFKANSVEKTGDDVWNWLSASGHLKSLRVGNMTVSQLVDSFNKEFKLSMSFTDFSKIFNSMCKIDDEGLKRIKSFKEYLDKHDDLQFVLVSHTNYSHLNYVLSQIGPIFGKDNLAVMQKEEAWSNKAKVLLAPSMSSKCEQHPDTLKYAFTELKVGKEDNVISFLNTIQKYEHDHFAYVDAGKNLEKVTASLDESLKNNQKSETITNN